MLPPSARQILIKLCFRVNMLWNACFKVSFSIIYLRRKRDIMRKSSEMYPIVERWKKSGLSKKNFCKQEVIPLSVMNYWVVHYNKRKISAAKSNTFLPLKVTNPPESRIYLVLVLSSGARLNFHQKPDLKELSLILSKCWAWLLIAAIFFIFQ